MSNCAVGLFLYSAVTWTNSHPPLYYYHPPACILIVQCITKPIVHYLFRRQCIIFKFLGFNISPQGGGLLNYITLGWAGWRNFRAASKRIGLLRKLNHLAVYDSTILHCFRINPTWTKTFTNPPHQAP